MSIPQTDMLIINGREAAPLILSNSDRTDFRVADACHRSIKRLRLPNAACHLNPHFLPQMPLQFIEDREGLDSARSHSLAPTGDFLPRGYTYCSCSPHN